MGTGVLSVVSVMTGIENNSVMDWMFITSFPFDGSSSVVDPLVKRMHSKI
jgi:hypothetical protein